jgi:hypothetical protein
MQAHLVGLSEIHKDSAIVPAHSMRHLSRDVVMLKHAWVTENSRCPCSVRMQGGALAYAGPPI